MEATEKQVRLALVTGASHGIGRAVAMGLARAGYRVILNSRSIPKLEDTARRITTSGGRASVVAADIATPEGRERIAAACDEHGARLDVVFHGASPRCDADTEGELARTDDAIIDSYAATAFAGTAHLVRLLFPYLAAAGRSNLILIASDWALRGSHGPPVFSAAKAAVAQFGRTVRRQASARGIQVTVLFPGDVASFDLEWKDPKWQLDDPVEDVVAELGNSRIPLVDIVETVLFVAARRLCRVEEVYLAPLDPDYDY